MHVLAYTPSIPKLKDATIQKYVEKALTAADPETKAVTVAYYTSGKKWPKSLRDNARAWNKNIDLNLDKAVIDFKQLPDSPLSTDTLFAAIDSVRDHFTSKSNAAVIHPNGQVTCQLPEELYFDIALHPENWAYIRVNTMTEL